MYVVPAATVAGFFVAWVARTRVLAHSEFHHAGTV